MTKKILLIHQEKDIREKLEQAFTSHGYKILSLRKSDNAETLVQNENPEAIVLAPDLIAGELNDLSHRLQVLLGNSTTLVVNDLSSVLEAPKEASTPESAAASAANLVAAQKLVEFQTMFEAVKLRYAKSLQKKFEQFERDLKASKEDPKEKEQLELARQSAHKMVGTAGSYGFISFSTNMKEIENLLIQLIEKQVLKGNSDQSVFQEQWLKIDSIVNTAKEEALKITQDAEQNNTKSQDEKPSVTLGPVFARVLFVDEDQAFLDVVEELGRQCNLAILKANDAQSALNLALMHQLDAAIIDIRTGYQDQAFKLSLDLRSMPGYDTLPLAFISCDANMKPAVEAAHVGASLHLDKPLDRNALEAAVRHLVAIRQGGRPKVMLVDDDPDFTAKIAFDLRNDNLLVKAVHDPLKVLDALAEFPPDVMLLDVMMPSMNGFEVCQMLRNTARWRDLPIIFITAEIHVDARVKAFTSGADDYLPKPVVTEELLARVRVRLEKSRLLKERSDKDTITGLLLRRAFVEQFNAMLADAERSNSIISICLMDVDHFKKVNDTYGHMAGDAVLAGFGRLLLRRFRVDDIRGRWGGEEFIIAFKRENKSTMKAAIDRVQAEFSNMIFTSDDDRKFQVSFSGGIASFPDDGKNLYELLTIADKRLYEAKHAGRKRIFISDNS